MKKITKLADLTPDSANANKGTERGRYAVQKSLEQTGAGRSIVVDREGRVIAGNKTLEAFAEEVGSEIEVVKSDGKRLVVVQRTDLDLSDPNGQARLMAFFDNRAAELNLAWDAEQMLAATRAGVNLEAMFSPDEINDLIAGAGKGGGVDEAGNVESVVARLERGKELNQKWQVKAGDVWTIGNHRMACGDSTNAADVQRLMNGQRAACCFTSPPYGAAREYKLGKFDWLALMTGVSQHFADVVAEDGAIVVNLGLIHLEGRVIRYWDPWLEWMEANGHPLYGWYVWDKQIAAPGEWRGRLAPQHEWLFHFASKPRKLNKTVKTKYAEAGIVRYSNKKVGLRMADGNIRRFSSAGKKVNATKVIGSVISAHTSKGDTTGHPATFSVAFAVQPIEVWARHDEIVYEPFLGAATSMVAAESIGRRCYGVEINPEYCAVVLQRMADAYPALKIEKTNGKVKGA